MHKLKINIMRYLLAHKIQLGMTFATVLGVVVGLFYLFSISGEAAGGDDVWRISWPNVSEWLLLYEF